MSQLICLICCSPWISVHDNAKHFLDASLDTNDNDSISQKQEYETNYNMFEVFCQHINVKLVLNPCKWNFSKEPLPFCPDCREMVTYIFNLHNQLQNIQNELKSVVENVKLKIENSDENFNRSSEMLETTEMDKRISEFRRLLIKSTENEDEHDLNIEIQLDGDNTSLENDIKPAKRTRSRRIKMEANYVELSGDSSEDNFNERNSSKLSKRGDQNSDSNHSHWSSVQFEQMEGVSGGEDSKNSLKQTRKSSESGTNSEKRSKKIKTQYKDTDESNYDGDENDGDSSDEDFDPGSNSRSRSRDTGSGIKPNRTVERTEDGKLSYAGIAFIQVKEGFQCCICPNRMFKRKGGMLVHIRQVHLGERSNHTCLTCGRNCDSPYALKLHESTHMDEKNFICSECGKAFKNNKNLRRHLLETHKLLLKFACVHCKMRFKTKEELDDHINGSHDSPAPSGFYCDCCGKCFNKPSRVKDHQRVHRKEKYFKCAYCGSNFLQKQNLNLHFLKEHGIKI